MPSTPSPHELAARWLRHHRLKQAEDFQAWDLLTTQVFDAPEAAWAATLVLVAQALDDEELGAIAAGPLEHLCEGQSDLLLPRIEAAAAEDPKFRECLGMIWLNSHYLPPTVVARLVAASGGRIEPFDLDYDQADRAHGV